jgi:ATP-dependent RNA helicase RhlE
VTGRRFFLNLGADVHTEIGGWHVLSHRPPKKTKEDITTVTFEELELHSTLIKGVTAMGYDAPTPIQVEAIPPALAGRDTIACAPTGTGKTAAFLLPTLQTILNGPQRQTRALVLTPTRELAIQVDQQVQHLVRFNHLTGTAVYGGVPLRPQQQALSKGTSIVTATPGRLLDHLKNGGLSMRHIQILVLDEADRMLDMGFLPDIRRILTYLPHEHQTLLFSATMPQEIERLAASVLQRPIRVQVGGETAPANNIIQTLWPVPEHLKTSLLMELLREDKVESALVFARTKRRTERLARQLTKSGIKAAEIHGDCSQRQRVAALEGFRQGRYRVLVGTDVAGRGIDVEGISHVFNYDMPDTVESYIHRAGRTGRVKATGQAVSLVTPSDEPTVRGIERAIGQEIERRSLSDFDYSVEPPSYMGRPAAIVLQNQTQKQPSLRNRWASMNRRRR